MCIKSCGRLDFAHALIDIKDNRPIKDTRVIVIPYVEGSGSYLHTIKVEYEWKPPRCRSCSVFGHDDSQYRNHVVSDSGAKLGADLRKKNAPSHMRNVAAQNDGFQVVQNRKPKGKQHDMLVVLGRKRSKVDLRNSFEVSKESDKLFENVGTSIVVTIGNTVKEANKSMEESDSDIEDLLMASIKVEIIGALAGSMEYLSFGGANLLGLQPMRGARIMHFGGGQSLLAFDGFVKVKIIGALKTFDGREEYFCLSAYFNFTQNSTLNGVLNYLPGYALWRDNLLGLQPMQGLEFDELLGNFGGNVAKSNVVKRNEVKRGGFGSDSDER
ncbi:hypothetical protein Tco_1523670 [Tanacetum coccineum]